MSTPAAPGQPPTHSREELHAVYIWVDEIPLSRVKKNILRDFSDGVLMAELVHHFYPRLVEVHNYISAHGVAKKLYNWTTLKKKVFSRMRFPLEDEAIDGIVNARPGHIQDVLFRLREYVTENRLQRIQKKQRVRQARQRQVEEEEIRHVEQEQLRSEMDVLRELVEEKENKISQLKDTVRIMEAKIARLTSLVELKDRKIGALTAKVREFATQQQ